MKPVNDSPYSLPATHDNFYIFFDETGTCGQQFYGFGFLWIPAIHLDRFHTLIGRLRNKHRYHREIKWTKICSAYCDFYLDLVDLFFEHNWLRFDTIRVKRSAVRSEFHDNSLHLGMRKHCTIFIASRLEAFAAATHSKTYQMLTDLLPYPYARSAEAMEVVLNNRLRRSIGHSPIHGLQERNSKEIPGIQLADLLLGAALEPWNKQANPKSNRGEAKYRVIRRIAQHIGWIDLRSDTFPWVWKYNICHFFPTDLEEREITTRQVASHWNLRRWKGRLIRRSQPASA